MTTASQQPTDEQVAALLRTLKKLPPHAGITYRGFDEEARFGKRVGEALVTTGLTATSRDIRVATENSTSAGLYVVAGKRGRAIENYSQFPTEREVVFLPSTLFRVVRQARLGELPVVIVEELDPTHVPEPQADGELEPWQEWLRVAARSHLDAAKAAPARITSPGKYLGDIA